jgi:hypothetical protein
MVFNLVPDHLSLGDRSCGNWRCDIFVRNIFGKGESPLHRLQICVVVFFLCLAPPLGVSLPLRLPPPQSRALNVVARRLSRHLPQPQRLLLSGTSHNYIPGLLANLLFQLQRPLLLLLFDRIGHIPEPVRILIHPRPLKRSPITSFPQRRIVKQIIFPRCPLV